LAQEGAAQKIQMRDAAGNVSAEEDVRPATHLNNLLWSTFAPNRVWGLGLRTLVAATLSG
jgi:hypothetical protein